MQRMLYGFACVLFLATVSVASQDLTNLFPDAVGDLPRVKLLTGVEAQKAVDALHGKSLAAEASAVAYYGQTERPAEVWVSQVESSAEARRQTGLMVHLMYENPKSPFKNPRRIEHAGMGVYRFEGMGLSHLIWFKEDLIYWVSVKPSAEQLFLDTFCQ